VEQTIRALVAVDNRPLTTIRARPTTRRDDDHDRPSLAAENGAFSETDDGNEPAPTNERRASFSEKRGQGTTKKGERGQTRTKRAKSSKTLSDEQIQRVTNLVRLDRGHSKLHSAK
jgi:hypothetical protein